MTLRVLVQTTNAIENVHLGTPPVVTYKTFDIYGPTVEAYLSGMKDLQHVSAHIIGVEIVRDELKGDANGE